MVIIGLAVGEVEVCPIAGGHGEQRAPLGGRGGSRGRVWINEGGED
jgi:hypothetical protein